MRKVIFDTNVLLDYLGGYPQFEELVRRLNIPVVAGWLASASSCLQSSLRDSAHSGRGACRACAGRCSA